MTRRMLINALRPEELRVAVIAGSNLENYQVEAADQTLTRGNIYRGVVTHIQPGLNAAFIDYGAERNGFLAIQDVVPEAYHRSASGNGRPRIEDVLEKNRTVLVQVTREAEGQKGAVLTTSLSLAGRYLVITPFDSGRGVSRKVEDEEVRRSLKAQVGKLDVPKGCGAIVRTNALDQSKAALNRDVAALLRIWKQIQSAAEKGKGPRLLYNDQDLILRALRDYLDSSIEEVVVDDEGTLDKASTYMKAFMPRGKVRLKHYVDRTPLFSRFELETQIDRIYERRVELPSGGSIVIDLTEALTAIDVNSGKSTKAASQEETALAVNLEAAREVARQLRLRDIGGLVVVDFIDMRASKSQRKVERILKTAMKVDKARFSVGRISSNGLLEINRQKIQQSLALRTHRACPTCAGTGRIASPEMVGLSLLRRIEGRASSGALKRVRVALHPELADAIQNHRRRQIARIEEEFDIVIELIAASHLHRPEQEVDWVERDPSEARQAPRRQKASVSAAQMFSKAVADLPEDDEDDDDDRDDGDGDGGGDDNRKSGRSRKRRRRRRRGKGNGNGGNGGNGGDEEQKADSDSNGDSDRDDEGEDDDDKGSSRGRGRSRRGSRGGRGRRRRGNGDDDSPADDAAARQPSSDGDDGGSKSRALKGRKADDGSEQDGKSAASDAPSSGDPSSGDPSSSDKSSEEERDDSSGRKRGRGSRGRRGRGRSARDDGDGSARDDGDEAENGKEAKSSRSKGDDSADDDEKAPEQEGEKTPRRGRGRRRPSSRSEKANTSGGDEADGGRDEGGKAARGDGDEDGNDGAESKSRRPRRTRKSRVAGSGRTSREAKDDPKGEPGKKRGGPRGDTDADGEPVWHEMTAEGWKQVPRGAGEGADAGGKSPEGGDRGRQDADSSGGRGDGSGDRPPRRGGRGYRMLGDDLDDHPALSSGGRDDKDGGSDNDGASGEGSGSKGGEGDHGRSRPRRRRGRGRGGRGRGGGSRS